jgi:hypothetical protein
VSEAINGPYRFRLDAATELSRGARRPNPLMHDPVRHQAADIVRATSTVTAELAELHIKLGNLYTPRPKRGRDRGVAYRSAAAASRQREPEQGQNRIPGLTESVACHFTAPMATVS